MTVTASRMSGAKKRSMDMEGELQQPKTSKAARAATAASTADCEATRRKFLLCSIAVAELTAENEHRKPEVDSAFPVVASSLATNVSLLHGESDVLFIND